MWKRFLSPVLFLSLLAPLILSYFYLTYNVDPHFERLGRALEVAMINSLTFFIAAWFFSGTGLLKVLFICKKKEACEDNLSTPLIILIFSLLYLLNLQLLQLIVAHYEQTVLDRGFIVVLVAALFLNGKRSIIICCCAILIRLGFYFYHDPNHMVFLANPSALLQYDWLLVYPGVVAIVMAFLTGSLCRNYFITYKVEAIPPWVGFTLAIIIEPIYLGALLKQKDMDYVTLVLTTETVPNILALSATMTILLFMLHGLYAKVERRQDKKAELAVLQENLRYLRVQMNPHFLFNTLNTISHFITENPAYAKELLLDFSDMFRHVVHDETMLVSLEKELEFIEMYLSLERARLGSCLSVKFDVAPDILSVQIPTLVIQPLVENAIKHGRSEAQKKLNIHLSGVAQGDNVILIVTDDGKGIKDVETVNNGDGIGLKNIRQRLQLLYDDKAKLEIQSTWGEGTRVKVIIPVKHSMPVLDETENLYVTK